MDFSQLESLREIDLYEYLNLGTRGWDFESEIWRSKEYQDVVSRAIKEIKWTKWDSLAAAIDTGFKHSLWDTHLSTAADGDAKFMTINEAWDYFQRRLEIIDCHYLVVIKEWDGKLVYKEDKVEFMEYTSKYPSLMEKLKAKIDELNIAIKILEERKNIDGLASIKVTYEDIKGLFIQFLELFFVSMDEDISSSFANAIYSDLEDGKIGKQEVDLSEIKQIPDIAYDKTFKLKAFSCVASK